MDCLKRSGGRWTAVISLAAFGLLLAAPAFGFSAPDSNGLINRSQSIESETTFDLFEDEYDFMLMPAYTGFFEDDGRFYTQLANRGDSDHLQFAHYRPWGPGYFTFRVGIERDGFDGDGSRLTVDGTDDGPGDVETTRTTADAEDEFNEMDLYLGYGWELGSDNSLGFAVDVHTDESSFETEGTFFNDFFDDGFSDTDNSGNRESEFDETTITLLGEYMQRGDNSWRIRAFVQDVEINREDETTLDNLFASDTVTDMRHGRAFSNISTTSFGIGGISGIGVVNGISSVSTDSAITDIGYDGIRFGAEGDIRFEKNATRHHQLNLGYATADFDPITNNLAGLHTMQEVAVDGGNTTTTEIDQRALLTADDITEDNLFATWKTRWNLGKTHIAAGAYFFSQMMEIEAGWTTFNNTDSIIVNSGGTTTTSTLSENESFRTSTYETTWTTFALPVALEHEVTKRVTLRLGAAWTWDDFTDELSTGAIPGSTSFTDRLDSNNNTGPTAVGDETTTTNAEFTSTSSGVDYNAGLEIEFDRFDLEFLFADNSTNNGRNTTDFSEFVIGATFKLGQGK